MGDRPKYNLPVHNHRFDAQILDHPDRTNHFDRLRQQPLDAFLPDQPAPPRH